MRRQTLLHHPGQSCGRAAGTCRGALALLAALLLLAGCARDVREGLLPEPLESEGGAVYEPALEGVPGSDMADVMRRSLRLFTLVDRPPPSEARLRRRAEGDVALAGRILRSEGFYQASVDWRLGEAPQAGAARPLTVVIEPGPRFVLGEFRVAALDASGQPLDAPLPRALPDPATLGFETGAPARSADIVAAEAALVQWLRDHGYPYARHLDREAVADVDGLRLNVTTRIEPGPPASMGALRFDGLDSVREDYLRRAHPWLAEGEFSQQRLDDLQRDMASSGLFEFVTVEPLPRDEFAAMGSGAAPAPAPAPVPVHVQVQEARHRSVGGGLRYSTDIGPSARAYLEHRNLLGAAERLRLDVSASPRRQELGATLRKPAFVMPRQSLVGGLRLRREQDDAFDEHSLSASVGLERVFSERLGGSAGISLDLARFEDSPTDGNSVLLGVPLGMTYDSSDDLLDPRRGVRLGVALTPYGGSFDGEAVTFAVLDANASTYLALDDAADYVLALRGRAGSLAGASRDSVPPSKRLYSGGGGSVRGYESRYVGPLDGEGEPLGGRSVLEAGLEMRVRVSDSIGVVPFLEAGSVSTASLPDLDEGVQFSAGLGVRYYTPIGPVRADIGVPLNGREQDDAFQFYISIGQAF